MVYYPIILKAHCHPECIAGISHTIIVENCHLGINSQSEHGIQQINPAKTKVQSRKAAWVNMGL